MEPTNSLLKRSGAQGADSIVGNPFAKGAARQPAKTITVSLDVSSPAPLGLMAFATVATLLMSVDVEWVEPEFKEVAWAYAVWYSGVGQLIVGFFQFLKGNTFGATAFTTFGSAWLSWATMWHQIKTQESFEGGHAWLHGEVLFFVTFGVITSVLFIATLRKKLCLTVLFFFLTSTFFLYALAVFNEDLKMVAGYSRFASALSGAYIAIAELFAHEWGYHFPGMQPVLVAGSTWVAAQPALRQKGRLQYDPRTNTLLMDFRNLCVASTEDVEAMRIGIETKVAEAGQKVHAVVNYHGFIINPHFVKEYKAMVKELQKDSYLSVTRLGTDGFSKKGGPSILDFLSDSSFTSEIELGA